MEDENKTVPVQGDSLQSNSNGETQNTQSPPEEVIDEMIKKVSLGEGSSDEEYLSAEEEDEAENLEVIKCINETSDVQEDDEGDVDTSGKDEMVEEENEKEEEAVDEMEEQRKKEESSLTEEERIDRRDRGQTHKDEGNVVFRNGKYNEAIVEYTKALDICPLNFLKERAIMFANRAACKMKMEAYEEAIKDSTRAIELHPQYLKAILRRAELYEKTEKLDEALKDYETVLELDPGNNMARVTCVRLQEQIKDRNEKMKAEMMGKLKDLGNLVLRPFGLSTNNFNLQQDPATGSYSMQFQQNATDNGS